MGRKDPRGVKPDDGIKERIETFLGEFRIIVPALGALLGFQLIASFQTTFQELAWYDKAANFAALACTATALLFLLLPTSYHRFTTRLEETADFLAFAQRNFSLAFVFLPIGLTLTIYVQAVRTFGSNTVSLIVAGVFFASFVLAWWIIPFRRARKRGLYERRAAAMK